MLFTSASVAFAVTPDEPNSTDVPVIFGQVKTPPAKPAQTDPGEATLTEEHAGARTTLFGKLTDTSALDTKRGVVEIVCSRLVIEEEAHHHAAYLDLVMVFDLKKQTPLRLLVQRSGYFLE